MLQKLLRRGVLSLQCFHGDDSGNVVDIVDDLIVVDFLPRADRQHDRIQT